MKGGLRSKRFRGAEKQRKTGFSFFCSRYLFHMGKTLIIPFLSLSLLPNPMETLATKAK